MEQTDTIEKVKTKLSPPKKWAIILHDDDETPMDFVVALLVDVFNHPVENAISLMMTIHEKGSVVAGTYAHEIAIQKHTEAAKMCHINDMVLRITMEQE